MMPSFAAKADTTALKQALIQACIGNVKFVDHLQVMGVLCVSVDDEPLEIVVKVNDLLQKRPSLQVQQDKSGETVARGGKTVSSGAPNRVASGYGAGGRASVDGKQPQAADSTKQQHASDASKQRAGPESGKVQSGEHTKQAAAEQPKAVESNDAQTAAGNEPKRMRIITVGDDVKQRLAAKGGDEDSSVAKDAHATPKAGTASKEGGAAAGDTEIAALQLLALKASHSSPSVSGTQAHGQAAYSNSQANSETGEGEPETMMQVDYDVELDVDGTATKPKGHMDSPRHSSPTKSHTPITGPYILRVGAQDRRSGLNDAYGSQKVSLITPYGNEDVGKPAAKRGGVGVKQTGTIEVYNCAECGATFAMRRDLRMHVARTAHKPFKCPECARLFKDWQGLEGHALKHIGAKPWTCARCQRAYYSRPATLCHIETVHAVELEMEAQKFAQMSGQGQFGANSFVLGTARSRNRKGAASMHSQTQVQALIKRIAYDASTKQFLAKLRRANMTAIPATRSAVARAFVNPSTLHEQQEVDVKLESELDFVASNTELAAAYDEEIDEEEEAREYEYYDEDDEAEAEEAYEDDEEC